MADVDKFPQWLAGHLEIYLICNRLNELCGSMQNLGEGFLTVL